MRRTVAFVALVALSCSQLVALHCDLAAGAPGEADHAAAMAPHAGSPETQHAPHGPPATPHGQQHGDSEACPMILACGATSVRSAPTVALVRTPPVLEDARFFSTQIPLADDLAIDPPPPRHAA